jgi:TRAP-type mannitol/chloroaromatic compound transport system permease large subunit
MVVYAIIVEASIGKLLVAGFIPGFISAICYSIIVVIWSIWNPNAGKPIYGYTWRERFNSLPGVLPVTAVILIIFASMLFGWATPTEAEAGALCLRHRADERHQVAGVARPLDWPARMIFTQIWGVLIFVRFPGCPRKSALGHRHDAPARHPAGDLPTPILGTISRASACSC